MEIDTDIYYKNKKTGTYQIFHDTITEAEIVEIIKERNGDKPMWMNDDWEIDDVNISLIRT